MQRFHPSTASAFIALIRISLFILFIITVVAGPAGAHVLAKGDEAYPPFEYLDSNGRPAGFNVDVIRAVCRVMGIDLELEMGPWNKIRAELENGRIDLLTGMFYRPDRTRLVEFSKPFTTVTYAVFVREGSGIKGLGRLKGREVMVQHGDSADDYLTKTKIAGSVLRVKDPGTALRRLAAGKADAALLSRIIGWTIIRKSGLKNIKSVGEPVLPHKYCFAAKKGDEALVAALDEGLAIIKKTGEFDAIYEKWFGMLGEKKWTRKAWLYASISGGVLLGLIGLTLAWIWSLRRQVGNKTVELRTELDNRRLVERALIESEGQLRSLLSSLNDAIFTCDPKRVITHCNPAFLRQFQYERGEIIGRSTSLLHTSLAKFKEFGDAVYPQIGQKGFWRGEWDFRRKDGSELPSELVVSAQRGITGEAVGYVAVIRDITQRRKAREDMKRLEAELRQAQKMEALGTLAGGIAHDFNNILGIVVGYAELAMVNNEEGETAVDEIGKVIEAADRAKELVRQILTFSRKARTDLAPVDLNKEIMRTIALLDRTIPKMIEIVSRLEPRLDAVLADSTQIEQVVMNLGGNAKDAMPDGGRLVIETANVVFDEADCENSPELVPGPYVRLTVSDDGMGMDEETRRQVFDPFFTTKGVGKGTGLGLATVFGIVKSHGGHVTCHSRPGEGTSFDIYLPAHDPKEAASSDSAGTRPKEVGGNEAILIVDDEQGLREVGTRILESAGYRVLQAESGEQAIELFNRSGEDIELVMLDMGMPGMGGYQCQEELLKLNPDLKVLIVSGYALDGRLKENVEFKSADYVAKPYRRDELLSIVRKILNS